MLCAVKERRLHTPLAFTHPEQIPPQNNSFAFQNKIRLECKKRRIRLNDFFTTFDRLHTKRCTKSQFYRALTISNITLTTDEVDMLLNRYEVPADMMPDGKSDMVNYKKFCDQIDKVFAVRGLEKNPTKQVKLALEDVGEPILGPGNPLISAVESEEVKEVRTLFV